MKRLLSLPLLLTALLSHAVAQEKNETPDALFQQGVELFFAAKPKESVAAFDKLITLVPDAKPQLWQRGLALYYAGDFKGGREQFEVHQTVNGNDVENAAWHFLCIAKGEGVEAARKVFIPIEGDSRIPMKEVHELFAGKGSEEAVLKAAEEGAGERLRNHRCFAHLYLGLYFEATGDDVKAKAHMLKAAKDFSMDHYMGRVAQVHVKLRGWE
ncbi:tetratricopeptide repeat protein [Prosthecobacter sp.]|uniref:tetratricopeptide repeat protein n=1 Tax=Prosthecobacter sp. TaxID=1965333 RepID=UPI0037831E44